MEELRRERRKYGLLNKKFPKGKQKELNELTKNTESKCESKERAIVTTFDHFASPVFKRQMKNMNTEEKEMFEKMGINIYDSVDYEKSKIYNPVDDISGDVIESLADIKSALSSGLHPSRLTSEEINILIKCLGHTWYKTFGFELSDLEPL